MKKLIYVIVLLFMALGNFLYLSNRDVDAFRETVLNRNQSANDLSMGEVDNKFRSIEDDQARKGRIISPPQAKEVFLTFDDGPSTTNTLKVLNILKENGVTATFFIVGRNAEENPDIVRELYNSGMCVAAHSYSHDYKIYKSKAAYMEDLNKCILTIRDITGHYPVPFIRLPGGSDNYSYGKSGMKTIQKEINNSGISYVDWNVSSADAAIYTVPSEKIISNITGQCRAWRYAVVLMHDAHGKATTVAALPQVIRNLKAQGFVFKNFYELTEDEKSEFEKLRVINRK